MRHEVFLPGARLKLVIHDLGDGPVRLFFHGFEGPVDEDELEAWARPGRRLIAPSHPGFGESEDPGRTLSPLEIVLVYRELLDVLRLLDVLLIGPSLGGAFAVWLAAASSPGSGTSAVAGLVLINPLGLWLDEAPTPSFLTSEGSEREELLGRVGRARARHVGDEGTNLAAAARLLWPLGDLHLADTLPFVRQPTLLLHGARDRLVRRAHMERFREILPTSRLLSLPNAGHLPLEERSASAWRAIEELEDSLSRPRLEALDGIADRRTEPSPEPAAR